MIKLVTLAVLLCAGSLPACTKQAPQRYDSQFITMGTQATLSIWADSPIQAAQISKIIEQQLQQQSIDWYAWSDQPTSELRQLNTALQAHQSFKVSDELANLLNTAILMHKSSQGFFDPAIMPMTAAWGFADHQKPAITALPSQQSLEQWRQHRPRISDLELRGHDVSSKHPDLQLDLGAIAKGYALDLVIKQLHAEGIAQASINLGGQALILGASLPSAITEVNVQDPRRDDFIGSIALRDGESISTSGDYQRNSTVKGRAIHHLFDPHTGEPVNHTQAVTVIANSGALADAASTAIMVAGPEHWQAVALSMGIENVLRIDSIGNIQVTTSLHSRLRLTPETSSHHSIQLVAL